MLRGSTSAFLDGDDVGYADKLEKQLPLFDGELEPGLVFSDRDLIDEHSRPISGCQLELHRGGRLYEKLLDSEFCADQLGAGQAMCVQRCRHIRRRY